MVSGNTNEAVKRESCEVTSVLDSPDNSFTVSVAGEPDVEGIIDLLGSVAAEERWIATELPIDRQAWLSKLAGEGGELGCSARSSDRLGARQRSTQSQSRSFSTQHGRHRPVRKTRICPRRSVSRACTTTKRRTMGQHPNGSSHPAMRNRQQNTGNQS